MDAELVQELRQLREAVERLRKTMESAADSGMATAGRNGVDAQGRIRQLAALVQEGAISEEEFQDGKERLLAQLLDA